MRHFGRVNILKIASSYCLFEHTIYLRSDSLSQIGEHVAGETGAVSP
jgi:hypothetical protein